MSFFGFDTTLPRDRNGGGRGGAGGRGKNGADAGGLESTFGSGGIEMDDAALDAKIRGLTAGAQEDVEVSRRR